MKSVTFQANAYFRNGVNPRDLTGGNDRDACESIHIHAGHDMSSVWVPAGVATVTVELIGNEEEAVAAAVEMLRSAASKARADGEMAARAIEEQISNMLALTNEVLA